MLREEPASPQRRRARGEEEEAHEEEQAEEDVPLLFQRATLGASREEV
jgi:hypothetical protein